MAHPVRITVFGGVAPRFDPRALPDPYAQTASNTKLWDGTLRPWQEARTTATPSKSGTKLSIYRFGQDVSDETLVLSLPGTSGSYASTPDSAAVSMTTELDLRVKVAADDWTGSTFRHFLSKRVTSGGQGSWGFRLFNDSSSTVTFYWTENGSGFTTKNSTATLLSAGAVDGQPIWIRATFVGDNGSDQTETSFYTSQDGESWTQLGATVTTPGAVTIFDSTAPIEIGSFFLGTSELLGGKFYYAEVRDGIDGTVVAKFDPDNDAELGDTSFTSSTGEVWTIHGNATLISETRYWFHWTTDVDVAKGPIAGDTSERTYYTGDGVPKVTDSSIALSSGTDYPMASYNLGIPAPAAAPSVAVSGTGSGTPVSKVYVYTYVSAWGEEGPPSDPSTVIEVETGETVNITGMSTGPGAGYNISTKRIYRTISGQQTTDYRFVAEVAVASTTYDDSVADSTVVLNEALPSATWDPPPSDMAGLVALPNGILAGFSKNDLCLSEPYIPSAWPEGYRLSCDWEIVGLGVIGQSVVVLTKGKPYIATGTHPSSFTLERLDVGQACVSKRSIASVGGLGVVYASPAGLALVSPGGSSVVTEGLMDRDDWQALVPSSIHGYEYNGRYFGFYDDGSTQGGFILDPKSVPPSLTFTDVYATAGYNDPIRDTLYLQVDDDIVKWDAGADALTYTWRSKVILPAKPFNPAFAQVEAAAYPVTFKLYADGALKHTESVASDAAFRLPGGYKARELEVELTGTQQVYAVYVGTTYRELEAI